MRPSCSARVRFTRPAPPAPRPVRARSPRRSARCGRPPAARPRCRSRPRGGSTPACARWQRQHLADEGLCRDEGRQADRGRSARGSAPATPAAHRRHRRRQRVRQVGEAAQTRRPALHHLVQVDRVVEALQRRQGGGVERGQPQAGADLHLGHADTGIAQPLEHLRRRPRTRPRHGTGRGTGRDARCSACGGRVQVQAGQRSHACSRRRGCAARRSKKATTSSMVSRKQYGSGSSASAIRRPLRSRRATRCATCAAGVRPSGRRRPAPPSAGL